MKDKKYFIEQVNKWVDGFSEYYQEKIKEFLPMLQKMSTNELTLVLKLIAGATESGHESSRQYFKSTGKVPTCQVEGPLPENVVPLFRNRAS